MTTIPVSIPDDARTVLLSVPQSVMQSTRACLEMVATADLADPRVFYVTFTQSPSSLRQQWRNLVGVEPAEFVVLDAREQMGADDDDADSGITVLSEKPNDLTWFGIHATEYLTRWHDTDAPIVVCFDSLSMLLQYAPHETVYRFLHVLAGRVESADGTGFYHIDPSVQDDTIVNTMAQLCDCRVTCDTETAEWSVRSR